MALRYENTDAPSEETSSVISRSLSQSNLEDIRQQSQRETQFPGRRQVVGQSRSSPHFVTRDQVGLDDMSSYAGTGNHNYYVSQSIADSTTQVEVNDASFIIPDTNVWNNSIQDENGVVQSVKEQEILSSIQELQRQLIDIRNEKDSWVRDGSKRGGGNEVEEAFPPVDNDAEDRSEVINTVQQESSRIVVVSNRLPVSMQKQKKADGRDVWTYEKTSGGLVSALRAAKENIDFIWVGWVGQFIPESERAAVRQTLVNDFGCVPVFLEVPVLNGYYHGFSNDILWPLFHYEPLPCFRPGVERKFDTSQWESYKRANLIFANAINDILEDGRDMVWIHDYHLMLVPKLLRKLAPKVPIGWFLHVPFPSSDVYRMLPVRRKILEGVLAADLVGFHTYDYMRHFLSSAARILGIESSPKGITTKSGHFCALGVFPIGIEPAFFQRVLERPSCQRRIAELCKRLGHCHILIGIDRLDYIKGMPHKLLAFEYLLRTHPEYHRNIVLIQVGVPSRVQVKEYQKLASQVNELVGRINGTFGTLDYTPIHYIQRPVSTEELCALYNVANACIITSVRDGMNLVSHEYVAMQESPCPASRDGPGMLVLSEFAGAAQSLSGAIRINPWNIGELAAAMHQALSTEKALRELQQKKLHRYVSLHTSSVWARSFLDELVASANNRIENEEQRIQGHNLRHHQKDFIDSSIIDNNAKAHNRPNLSRNERKGSNSDLKHSSKNTSQSEVESKYKKAGETKMNIMTANRSFMVPNMGAVRRRRLRRLPIFKMLQAYKQAGAKRKTGASSAKHIRALILDLDGLLAATGTVPLLSRPSPFVISYLLQLAMNPSNLLIILSGRSRTVLESWLKAPDGSQIDCAICAENGVFFRASAKHNWEYMGLAEELETWKSYVLPMIQFFADRTPGSRVEIKDGSLTWFYGDSDPAFASWQSKELRVHLDECMTNFAIMVTQSSEYLEVRSQGCTKARVVNIVLSRLSLGSMDVGSMEDASQSGLPTFVLCVGAENMNPSIFEATAAAYSEALETARPIADSSVSATSINPSSKLLESENGTAHTNSVDRSSEDNSRAQKHIPSRDVSEVQPKAKSRKELPGANPTLSSLGVFTCFYGGQKKRELTDAEFFVDSETDLRKILRGLVKLSADINR